MASTRTARRTAARLTRASFTRLPGSRKPFKRAIALHKQFIDTLASLADALPTDRRLAVEALPAYVSRGHGGRHRPTQRIVDSNRFQDRSKYGPNEEKRRHAPPAAGYSVPELLAFVDSIVAKTKPDARAV